MDGQYLMALTTARDDKDIKELAEQTFSESEDFFTNVKKAMQEDNSFSHGVGQWTDAIRISRETPDNARPCLTINKIDPNVRRIVNEAKQQKLTGKVKPVDDSGDIDTALVFEGLIRAVEKDSKARWVYMWAYEWAVRAGLGYYRIDDEYEHEKSFNIWPKISRIRNPLSVCWDKTSVELDGSDAKRVIIYDELDQRSITQELDGYGKKNKDKSDEKIWGSKEKKVMELFWIDYTDDEVFQLLDNSVILASEIDAQALHLLKKTEGVVKKSRKIKLPQSKWAYLVDGEVCDKEDINSRYIPVIRMIGREAFIEGKVDFRGITRNSMDSQRMYNVMSSLLVEKVGLAPRAPYIGAAGQFEGYEQKWASANVKNYSNLEYNPKSIGGVLVPPPQRADQSSGDPTIERYMNIAGEDIKNTSSIFDSYLGAQDNASSGVAIKARSAQSGVNSYDFLDNAVLAIEHGERILVDKFPRILTGPQAVRILGDDYKEKIVKLNQEFVDEKTGKKKTIDLSRGRFDVELDVGTGDLTRREKAVETLSQVMQGNREAAALLMDVLVSNMDIKDADKIAKRFRVLLPPEVIAAEEDKEKDNPELDALQNHAEKIIGEMKAQMEELNAKYQELAQQEHNKQEEIRLKEKELDLKQQEVDIKRNESEVKMQAAGDADTSMQMLQTTLQGIQESKQEVANLHEQMELVVQTLEKMQGMQRPLANQELPQPENASTTEDITQDVPEGNPEQMPPLSTEMEVEQGINNVGGPNG